MSDKTKIAWTDASWNPVRARDSAGTTGWHCERVSPGCQNCYAETINEKRFGTGLPYNRKSREMVEVYLDEKALTQPLHWRRPRKVFVCSMSDLFGEWVPDEMIDRVFAVMALSPRHTFQVLTKRPERMRAYLTNDDRMYVLRSSIEEWCPEDAPVPMPWPLPNVWLGVSAEDQQRADERIPELLATPAAVRFLSCEPLLGPVDLRQWLHDSDCWHYTAEDEAAGNFRYRDDEYPCLCSEPREDHISWVIVGGESGPGARPCDVEWIRGIVRQCRAAGTAVFVKQLGRRPYTSRDPGTLQEWRMAVRLRDRAGGDPSEWPEDLRVREFPEARIDAALRAYRGQP